MQNTVRFRACASAYWVLCGPFLAIALLWVAASLKTGELELAPIAVCVGAAGAWAFWLSRFELNLGERTFCYRSLLNRHTDVEYADVRGVATMSGGPVTGMPLQVALQMADGRKLPVNFKVFAKRAGAHLLERIAHEA